MLDGHSNGTLVEVLQKLQSPSGQSTTRIVHENPPGHPARPIRLRTAEVIADFQQKTTKAGHIFWPVNLKYGLGRAQIAIAFEIAGVSVRADSREIGWVGSLHQLSEEVLERCAAFPQETKFKLSLKAPVHA